MGLEPQEVEQLADRVRAALGSGDLTAIGRLLAPNARWGGLDVTEMDCQSRQAVLDWWRQGRDAGLRARVTEIVVGSGTLLVGLEVSGTTDAALGGARTMRWQVLTVESGQIVDIRGFDDRGAAALRAGVTG